MVACHAKILIKLISNWLEYIFNRKHYRSICLCFSVCGLCVFCPLRPPYLIIDFQFSSFPTTCVVELCGAGAAYIYFTNFYLVQLNAMHTQTHGHGKGEKQWKMWPIEIPWSTAIGCQKGIIATHTHTKTYFVHFRFQPL